MNETKITEVQEPVFAMNYKEAYYKMLEENNTLRKTVQAQSELIASLLKQPSRVSI